MNVQPAESPFALRWSLFGTRFCIRPSFWLMSALWGYLFATNLHRHASNNWPAYIGLWVGATLISVLVHELGHVIMGRIFGENGDITLAGMGGQAVGKYENLGHWQRIAVAASGPGAGFLFLGVLTLVDSNQWNSRIPEWFPWLPWDVRSPWSLLDHMNVQWRFNRFFFDIMFFLMLMNLFWNIINLIPIVPMDGGMIFKELCCIVSPQGGLKFAYGWSLLLAGSLTLYFIMLIAIPYLGIRLPFQPPSLMMWPILGAIMFGMMAWQSFQALRTITVLQQSEKYADSFSD